jgi:hypothetical protein
VQVYDDEENPISEVVQLSDPVNGSGHEMSEVPVGWTGSVLTLRILTVYPGQPCDGRPAGVEVQISELEVHADY